MTKTEALNKIHEATAKFEKLSGPQTELLDAIMEQFNTQEHPKTKVDDNGNTLVWCNFHKQYESAELFATRTDKNGHTKYKANCKEATQLINKTKRLRKTLDSKIVWGLRNGKLTADEVTELLNELDKVPENYDALKEFHNEVLGSKMEVTDIN